MATGAGIDGFPGMCVVTRKTGQFSLAFLKALAFGEIERLVTYIPGIGPIGIIPGRRRFAMAATAVLI
jgi:hypothetical protein